MDSIIKCIFAWICLTLAGLGAQTAAAEQPASLRTTAQTLGADPESPLSVKVINTKADKDSGILVVQNSESDAKSVYQTTIPVDYLFSDNVRSTVHVEGGSRSSVQHTAAYGAYVYNACSWGKAPHECNGVGLFSQAISGAKLAQSWPINTACNDNGYASSCGNEHDVTVQSALATYTLWAGIIQGSVQPANANGIQLSRVPGATAQWTYGFATGNGAAQNFASVGALGVSGLNVASQPFWMSAFDDNGREFAMKLQAAGHAMMVLDNTRADGLAFEAGNTLVGLKAIGSSRDVDLGLSAKGQGKLVAASDLDINAHDLRNVRTIHGASGAPLTVSCEGACATYIGSGGTNVLSVDGKENAVNPANASAELGTRKKAWAVTTTKMLDLPALTFADLPECDLAHSGTIAFVNDVKQPVTAWHQTVDAGGGSNAAFISCNGIGWHAFDY